MKLKNKNDRQIGAFHSSKFFIVFRYVFRQLCLYIDKEVFSYKRIPNAALRSRLDIPLNQSVTFQPIITSDITFSTLS